MLSSSQRGSSLRAKRLRRSGQRDRSAVSEIIGNILILGITVALFTGVMAFVSDIPEPPSPLRAEFTAELNGDILSITHRGGSDLLASDVRITLTVKAGSGDAETASFSHDDFTRGTSSDKWRQGSTWILDLDANAHRFPFTGDISYLHVSIAHLSLSDPLWTRLVKDDDVVQDVKISNIVVLDSDGRPHRTNWGGGMVHTINAGENYGIRVQVDSPSQTFISEVRADLSSLYDGGSPVVLTSLGGGEYRYTSSAAPTAENGWYRPAIEVIGENSIVLTSESFTVLLRDKSSTEDPGVPPVDPDPEDPDPEEPIGPGPSNPDMINDLYFLTPQQWQSFVDSDGSINVHDTYAVSGNKIVLAFKSEAITNLNPSKQWGAEVKESPHLFIYTYEADVGSHLNIREEAPGTNVEKLSLGGTSWNVYTHSLSDVEVVALANGGLFFEVVIKQKRTNNAGDFSADLTALAYGSFYAPDKGHVRVQSLNSNNQPQVLFEIGDEIRFDVTVSETLQDLQTAKFRALSLHDPTLDKSIAVSFLGAFGPEGRTLRFSMDSFEVVGVYLSNTSLFIYSENLEFDGNKVWASVKIYLEQGIVITEDDDFHDVIQNAQEGDTIRVYDQDIQGGLVIDKPLIIYGNNTTLAPSSTWYASALNVSSDDVEIRGFKIYISPNHQAVTINVTDSENFVFADNEVIAHEHVDGNLISLYNSPHSLIQNNIIPSSRNAQKFSIGIEKSPHTKVIGNSIEGSPLGNQTIVKDSEFVTIEGNTIHVATNYNSNAVRIFENSHFAVVRDNTLVGGKTGTYHIFVEHSHNVTIEGNEMPAADNHNRAAIYASNSPDLAILENTITEHSTASISQIRVQLSSRVAIERNILSHPAKTPATTIHVTGSPDAVVSNNVVVNGGSGPFVTIE